MLVVTQPFATYQRGDRITDAGLVATILSTEDARNVIAVGTPATPTPTPAQRTLLQLLADIAAHESSGGGGGGVAVQPQLIDALPDAAGNPPAGYEWLPGVAAAHNHGCALTDYVQSGVYSPVPCQTGVAQGFWGLGAPTMSVPFTNAATGNSGNVSVPTPAGALNMNLLGAQILSDTSLFLAYKVQAADSSWILNTCIAHTDNTLTNAEELTLDVQHPAFFVNPGAVAVFGGYYVMAFAGVGYLLVDASTGTQTLLEGAQGALLASDANGVYMQRGADPVLMYVPLTISVNNGVPSVSAGNAVIVMPIPGGSAGNLSSPYLPVGAATLPGGALVLCTRAGFFEVRTTVANGQASAAVKQTAGVHPLIDLSQAGSTNDDVLCMSYDTPSGTLRTGSRSGIVVIDYTTLTSQFVRKAKLIA